MKVTIDLNMSYSNNDVWHVSISSEYSQSADGLFVSDDVR